MAPLLEVEGLVRRYAAPRALPWGPRPAVRAVDGVSFRIDRGETLGLVGESGCGKSTVGRLAIGLDRPDGGTVRFDGADLAACDAAGWRSMRRRMQMVFQDTAGSLNPRLTVGGQVREPLDIHGIGTRAEREAAALEALRAVALEPEHARRYPHELSGGQQQRAVIARALVLKPDLVVCDEPVSALDLTIQAQTVRLLADLQRSHGLAYLFISHDLNVVRRLASRVAVMYLGRIVESGPTAAVLSAPRHPYARALLASVPVPDPAARGRPRLRPVGEPPDPARPPSGCAYHPRCPRATGVCRAERPALAADADGRAVACHHPETGAGPDRAAVRPPASQFTAVREDHARA
jgi:peptide/nickel transport system ATP-binding protein